MTLLLRHFLAESRDKGFVLAAITLLPGLLVYHLWSGCLGGSAWAMLRREYG